MLAMGLVVVTTPATSTSARGRSTVSNWTRFGSRTPQNMICEQREGNKTWKVRILKVQLFSRNLPVPYRGDVKIPTYKPHTNHKRSSVRSHTLAPTSICDLSHSFYWSPLTDLGHISSVTYVCRPLWFVCVHRKRNLTSPLTDWRLLTLKFDRVTLNHFRIGRKMSRNRDRVHCHFLKSTGNIRDPSSRCGVILIQQNIENRLKKNNNNIRRQCLTHLQAVFAD